MRQRDSVSCLPSGCTHIQFEKALGMPGSLKTSEYLLLAGPIGKYIYVGGMHPEQQTAMLEYLDLLGSLWEKTISTQRLSQLESDIPRVLENLEFLLPSWELDINRHLMLHLVSLIRANEVMLDLVHVWLRAAMVRVAQMDDKQAVPRSYHHQRLQGIHCCQHGYGWHAA